MSEDSLAAFETAGGRSDARLRFDHCSLAGLARDEIWTTNTVKCRPVAGEGPHFRNRAPTPAEIRLWQPLLEEELQLLAPKVIV